jgi:hypothetical protein
VAGVQRICVSYHRKSLEGERSRRSQRFEKQVPYICFFPSFFIFLFSHFLDLIIYLLFSHLSCFFYVSLSFSPLLLPFIYLFSPSFFSCFLLSPALHSYHFLILFSLTPFFHPSFTTLSHFSRTCFSPFSLTFFSPIAVG